MSSTLYIDRRQTQLEHDAGALICRGEHGERLGTIPLAPLKRIVLRGSVTISTSLLGKLGEHAIGILILSGKLGKPSLFLPSAHNDAQRRLNQCRHALDPHYCLQYTQYLIGNKLQRQANWFTRLADHRPQNRHPLLSSAALLQKQIPLINQAPDLANLRGQEGAAAAAYFAGLRTLIPQSYGFTTRQRRPAPDPFNALLSLTYTILIAEIGIALHAAGFDPYIGLYHQIAHGRLSLACDLMEPIRPLADKLCLGLISSQTLKPQHFSTTGGACLLNKTGRGLYYDHYEAQAQPLRQAIEHEIKNLWHSLCPQEPSPQNIRPAFAQRDRNKP